MTQISKPEDIPVDVWNAALATYEMRPIRCEGIARAILAERARCSSLLNNGCTLEDGEPVDPAIPEIFYAINEGIQP